MTFNGWRFVAMIFVQAVGPFLHVRPANVMVIILLRMPSFLRVHFAGVVLSTGAVSSLDEQYGTRRR